MLFMALVSSNGDISILNIYFPSGSSGVHRQAVKMRFLSDLFSYLKKLKQERTKLIICGDFNICHQAIDIHDPVRNKNYTGFLPEEREWMTAYFNSGFIDSFRYFNKESDHYTWWSYRTNARAKNKGWRIDYITVSKNLENQLIGGKIHADVYHSDHCPVSLRMRF